MAQKILIVDDAAFMRLILRNMLTENGYEVVGEATNGAAAIKSYHELKPDLVTMDITMPDMDGITAVREIKKIDPQAKIIMCSAMGQQAVVVDAVKAGAQDFLVKPFQADRVVEAIKRVLG